MRISKEQAEAICYREINRPRFDWPDMPELVVVRSDERERTWVVYYQPRPWVETGDFSQLIAGNGPYVISKATGEFAIAGTAAPLSDRLLEAENVLAAKNAFWLEDACRVAQQVVNGDMDPNFGCSLIAEINQKVGYRSELEVFTALAHDQNGHERFGFTAQSCVAEILDACHDLLRSNAV